MSKTSPSNVQKRNCFILSPIGKNDSKIREHADNVYDYILKPVLEKNEFKIERADKINDSGIITNQIIERIVKYDLIIAILTYDNPNVFYELALCHVARKPFIQMIEKDKKIPFDTATVRTIHYSLDDIKTWKVTEEKLENLIQQDLNGEMENPISNGLDALKLKESTKSEQMITAEMTAGILDKLQSLDSKMSSIQYQIIRKASIDPSDLNYELFAYNDSDVRDLPVRPNKDIAKILAWNFLKFFLDMSEEEKRKYMKKFPLFEKDKKEENTQKDKD